MLPLSEAESGEATGHGVTYQLLLCALRYRNLVLSLSNQLNSLIKIHPTHRASEASFA